MRRFYGLKELLCPCRFWCSGWCCSHGGSRTGQHSDYYDFDGRPVIFHRQPPPQPQQIVQPQRQLLQSAVRPPADIITTVAPTTTSLRPPLKSATPVVVEPLFLVVPTDNLFRQAVVFAIQQAGALPASPDLTERLLWKCVRQRHRGGVTVSSFPAGSCNDWSNDRLRAVGQRRSPNANSFSLR